MIYLDNAATTPLHPDVLAAMLPFLTEQYGNPNSLHRAGKKAAAAIQNAKEQLAAALHCSAGQIIFTLGGSMANNLACHTAVTYLQNKLHRPISCFTTAIEHSSMLAVMKLQPNCKIGAADGDGFLTEYPDSTVDFASVQFANNELGSIQDMVSVATDCKKKNILLHTDAVQAFGQIPIDLSALPVDMLSLSAHKFMGPKGVGALFVRDPRMLSPFIHGNNRLSPIAGTENVAGIVGLGAAAELAHKNLQQNMQHKAKLKQLLSEGLKDRIPDIRVLTPEYALPGILSVAFPGVESESLLHLFDLKSICVSSGAACHAGDKTPSHVLSAIGLEESLLYSAIRFSIGSQNTEDEILQTVAQTEEWVKRLRSLT